MTAGYWAAEALVERGVDKVFFIAGGHTYAIMDGFDQLGVQLVSTRHEQGSAFMAEAWGRMTRKPGVCVVTAGPGFTNALSAIASANFANTPLLFISGGTGHAARETWNLQDMEQVAIIQPMVKKVFLCNMPERIHEFVDMAWRACITGRPGPVYLEIPVDVANMKVDEAKVHKVNTLPEPRVVDKGKVLEFGALLLAAKKPIFIAGSGAYYSGAGAELQKFIEATGIPVFTSMQGRGVISDTHPLCFGPPNIDRSGAAKYALENADLWVLLGNRISLVYNMGLGIPKHTKIVQVDISPEEIGRNRSIDLPIMSDIRAFMEECNLVNVARNRSAQFTEMFAPWVAELKKQEAASIELDALGSRSNSVPIHPARLSKEIDSFMDREGDVVIADGGNNELWTALFRTCRKEGRWLESGLFACLGGGTPYAIAAKILYPNERVLNSIGDGAVGFNWIEFETAIRKNIPFVTVISNNLGWNMIRQSSFMALKKHIDEFTELGLVRYDQWIETMGGVGFFVEKPEDIRPALEAAFASGKPAIINVVTDMAPISGGAVGLAEVGGEAN
jgi:acetolactate synthase-1/2/3 large subunit